jgi:hypothetical protein
MFMHKQGGEISANCIATVVNYKPIAGKNWVTPGN